MEVKRISIAKAHNRLVIRLLFGLFAALLLLAVLVPHGWSKPHRQAFVVGFILLVIVPLEAYGIYWIFKRDEEFCRELGFMCPHCHKPLYEPRAFINITGRCPKCRTSVLL